MWLRNMQAKKKGVSSESLKEKKEKKKKLMR
jgi:hypothetical protein